MIDFAKIHQKSKLFSWRCRKASFSCLRDKSLNIFKSHNMLTERHHHH